MKISFLFVLLLIPFYQLAANYYVSPSGNNSNPGTAAQPWKTLQYSIDQLTGGDYLFVNDGVYNEKLVFHNSGTISDYISVWANGNNVVLDGTGLTAANAMIDITDHSYIWVKGLEIRNNIMNDAQGILVDGDCQGIKITDNKIHDIHFSANPNDAASETTNAQAIIVFGSSLDALGKLEISRNEVYNCRLGYSEGIAVNGNVDEYEIRENDVHDLTNIGIVAIGHEGTCSNPSIDQARHGLIISNKITNCNSPYAACAGIYIDGARLNDIVQNTCSGNDYGIEIGCEHPGKFAAHNNARNNIVFQNKYAGIVIGGYDYPLVSGSVENTSVSSNTLYHNDTDNDGSGEIVIAYGKFLLVNNNIIYTNSAGRAITYSDDPLNSGTQYNLFYTGSANQDNLIETTSDVLTLAEYQATGEENGGIFSDPLFAPGTFTEESTNPLNMGPNSPVVNAGDPMYIVYNFEFDYFGNTRIVGDRIDIGAGEYAEDLGLGESSASYAVYPNPAANDLTIASLKENTAYTITDLSGAVVSAGAVKAGKIDLQLLHPGTYLLTLQEKGTIRFVKQ